MMIACFESAHRGAENLGYVLIFHLVVVAHIEHQALFLGKAVDGSLQFFLNFVAVEIGVGFDVIEQE